MFVQLRPQQGQIGIIVLSPTRELTNQIAVEAQQLCKFHGFAVQVRALCPACSAFADSHG